MSIVLLNNTLHMQGSVQKYLTDNKPSDCSAEVPTYKTSLSYMVAKSLLFISFAFRVKSLI